MNSALEELLLNRAIEIRNNWKDVEKLRILVDAWDQEFGHKYDEAVERVIGKYLEEMWGEPCILKTSVPRKEMSSGTLNKMR